MWWCCWPKSQHSRSLGEKTAGGWTKFAVQISSISWPWHGAERLLHAPVHPSPARWHTGDSKQHHEPPQSPPHPSPPLGFKQPLFPFWGGAGGLLTGDPAILCSRELTAHKPPWGQRPSQADGTWGHLSGTCCSFFTPLASHCLLGDVHKCHNSPQFLEQASEVVGRGKLRHRAALQCPEGEKSGSTGGNYPYLHRVGDASSTFDRQRDVPQSQNQGQHGEWRNVSAPPPH